MRHRKPLFSGRFFAYANSMQMQSSCIRFAMQMQCKIMQIKSNKIKQYMKLYKEFNRQTDRQ